MKSTIRVDFAGLDKPNAGFNPVLRVNLEGNEDVRDGLLREFFQKLGGESSWLYCSFEDTSALDSVNNRKRISIYPVTPDMLLETIDSIRDRIVDITTSGDSNDGGRV